MTIAQFKTQLTVQQFDNYSFLKNGLNELYIQAIQAEKYAGIDGQSSLAKMRLFVELACHELGKFYGLRPPVSGELSNKIKQLESSKKVDAWAIQSMNRLRSFGNQSLHITEVNGHFVAQLNVSEIRMRQLLQDMHELAKYVANKVLFIEQSTMPDWQQNPSLELAESITLALSGDVQSSYAVAKHFFSKLALSESSNKQQRTSWQCDFEYWSNKALQQGCKKSGLLQANSYARKLMPHKESTEIKALYKKALLVDEEGEALASFAMYLMRIGEVKLGLDYLIQATEKGNHESLSQMQAITHKQDEQAYLGLIDEGLKLSHKPSYTLDLFEKIKRYEKNLDDEVALKALRSALIVAEAKSAPGYQFFKGYAAFISENKTASKGLTHQQCANMMVDHYDNLPIDLEVEGRLLSVIADFNEHHKVMLSIFERAMTQISDVQQQAQLKSAVAMCSIEIFKQKHSVKTPMPIRQMLQEAANDGDATARSYLNSTEGKALLKKGGFGTTARIGRKTGGQKAKDRKKNKAAKKARRK